MTDQPVVVVLGAGMGGRGVVSALAGKAHLVVVDRTIDLARAACDLAIAEGGSAHAMVVNLVELAPVEQLCADLLARHGHIDAVVHLVGGWRGSTTVDAAAIEQWQELLPRIVTTVQTTSVAFREALATAGNGRYVMVTSTSAAMPKKSNAAYASAKSAAETWVQALGDAFDGTGARAYIVAVKALVDKATHEANPDKKYTGFTDTADLGTSIANLITGQEFPNGTYVDLTVTGK